MKKAFGLANLELNVPMQPNNVFEIGSMTKQFTAIAILILLEKGKLQYSYTRPLEIIVKNANQSMIS